MSDGPLWTEMRAQPRVPVSELTRSELPVESGVYAFFRKGEPIYVGKAGSVQDRVWSRHCGRGRSLHSSAFRRNVAEHLGIASANDIYEGLHQPSADELAQIRNWIEECDVAWITRPTKPAAKALEDDFKDEWLPPLTKC